MNEKIIKYRTKHKKCKWCKYYKYNSLKQCHYITCYGECTLKDRIIRFEDIPTKCKYYEVKGDKEFYNQKISELYAVIENKEKIIRDLQEKIILLKASGSMLELTKEYGEKNLYKQRIDKAIEILKLCNSQCSKEVIEILKGEK